MSGIDNQMKFEELRDALETLLVANQFGRFRTVTEQRQSSDSKEHKGLLRSVQIFYSEGDFGNNSDDQNKEHEATFLIQYAAVASHKVDLSVLDNENSTADEYAAALAGIQTGEYLANRSLDELRRMIVQILLDPINKEFGMGYDVSSPRMNNFRKDQVINKGSIFEVSGNERFTAIVTETFAGETPTTAANLPLNIASKFVNPDGDPDISDPSKLSTDIDTTP